MNIGNVNWALVDKYPRGLNYFVLARFGRGFVGGLCCENERFGCLELAGNFSLPVKGNFNWIVCWGGL